MATPGHRAHRCRTPRDRDRRGPGPDPGGLAGCPDHRGQRGRGDLPRGGRGQGRGGRLGVQEPGRRPARDRAARRGPRLLLVPARDAGRGHPGAARRRRDGQGEQQPAGHPEPARTGRADQHGQGQARPADRGRADDLRGHGAYSYQEHLRQAGGAQPDRGGERGLGGRPAPGGVRAAGRGVAGQRCFAGSGRGPGGRTRATGRPASGPRVRFGRFWPGWICFGTFWLGRV